MQTSDFGFERLDPRFQRHNVGPGLRDRHAMAPEPNHHAQHHKEQDDDDEQKSVHAFPPRL